MQSSLLQQPHRTEATTTGEEILVGVAIPGGEATLAMVTGGGAPDGATGGEATSTGGNRWNV